MRSFFSKYFLHAVAGCFLAAMTLGGVSCKKDKLLASSGELRFSTDTLTFDTVFTSLGSATLGVKIFNQQDQKVVLSSVRVAGGAASQFRLNVDGRQGNVVNDVEIGANDSIYVFATVRVNPDSAAAPFFVESQLTATLNGRDFSIPIIAYGQNAHYITDSVLLPNQVWKNDKPYVIFGYCIVDSLQSLTIDPGCRIYMHANARLFVAGTLHANGTKKDSIIFQGDRLDRSYFGYEGYPGEWGGIYFTGYSTDNILQHVVIANGGNGAQGAQPAAIQVSPDVSHGMSNTPQLTLRKTTIENSIGYGLLSYGGTIHAENCLIHSCGADALALIQGGHYTLDYCTIATYGNAKIAHTDNPAAVILNYFYYDQTKLPYVGELTCTMRNCVIAGSLTNELAIDSDSAAPAIVSLQNCLVKEEADKIRPWVQILNPKYTTTTENDPQFKDITKADYHPKTGSPLVDAASGIPTILDDMDDNMRPKGNGPDIGCYELE